MRRLVALSFVLLCLSAAPLASASTAGATTSGAPAGPVAHATPADNGSAATPTTIVDPALPAAPGTTIDNSFLDTKRNLSECLNHSVDLPDCGIEPTQPGDRGGWLQGATFLVMTLGIVFICWRVYRSIKTRDQTVAPKTT